MFKFILALLALSCCALGVPRIPNRPPTNPPPVKELSRSVRDVSNDKNTLLTTISPDRFINYLKGKIQHVQQLGSGIMQKVVDTLKSIDIKGKCLSVVDNIFKFIKSSLKFVGIRTRHIREATDELSEDANALIDLNATLAITEGMFKLYKDIEANKEKLLNSTISLVRDFLPGLELQIKKNVGLIEIYIENMAHQAGHKLENATINKVQEAQNRLLDVYNFHPEVHFTGPLATL